MEWLQTYWRWIVFCLMVFGIGHWLTNSPEVRHYRWQMFLAMVLVCSLVFFMSAGVSLMAMVIFLVFARFIFTIIALLVTGPVTERISEGTVKTLFGGDEAFIPGPRYSLERMHRSAGRADLAIEILNKKLSEFPDDFEGWFLLSSIHAEDKKDLIHVERCMQRIFDSPRISQKYQEYAEMRLLEWRSYLDGNSRIQPQQRAVFKKPKTPTSTPSPIAAARLCRSHGQYDEAIRLLKAFLKSQPDHSEANLLMATIYAEDLKEISKAEQAIRTILDSDYQPYGMKEMAKSKLADWKRSGTKLSVEQPKVATRDPFFRKPEQTQQTIPDPEDRQAIFAKTRQLVEQGLYGSAVDALKPALKADPNDFEGLLLMAEIHAVCCHDLRKAESIIEKILEHRTYSDPQKQQAKDRFNHWQIKSKS